MGDETIQFASRFSNAVKQLAAFAGGTPKAGRAGAEEAAVRGALDAVGAVYETGTTAVRNWPEQGKRVLAQLAKMRQALERSGADAELRRMARQLVEMIEQGSGPG